MPPGTWNYDPQTWEWKDQSDDSRVVTARELYAQAGYSPKTPLRLRLLYNSNVVIKNTAILVAAMWKETLGIDTELTEEEYRVFFQSRHDKKTAGKLLDWDGRRILMMQVTSWTYLEHTPANNDEDYSNPSFDKLLEDAAQHAGIDAAKIATRSERAHNARRLSDYSVCTFMSPSGW